MKKVMITGCLGQIGSELVERLRNDLDEENVIATSINPPKNNKIVENGIFEELDVMDYDKFLSIAKEHNVDTIVHLAALLSAVAEANPQFAWDLNMQGLIHALEVGRELDAMVFAPSSIAVFGDSTPADDTPQDTIMRPNTIYGVTKVAGELLCDYYNHKYGLDTRSVRFPGLISYKVEPGGGTTDYAVDIYYEALKNKSYASYIDKGTYMDMMFMDDAVDCIIDLMQADPSRLEHRNSFNVTGMSFDPEQIAESIRKFIPDFELTYDVNEQLQAIASSWPNSLDDSSAREEWDFNPKYDLDKMTERMLKELTKKFREEGVDMAVEID